MTWTKLFTAIVLVFIGIMCVGIFSFLTKDLDTKPGILIYVLIFIGAPLLCYVIARELSRK